MSEQAIVPQAVPERLRKESRRRDIGLTLVLPVLLIAAWYLVTEMVPLIHPAILPSPVAVVRVFVRLALNGELLGHIQSSLLRIFYANVAALLLGAPIGLAMGMYRPVERLLDGLLSIFRPIPPLAWVPLAILWMGIGTTSIVFITFLAAFFAVLINSLTGARAVDKLHILAALSLGASQRRIMTYVVLPTVAPHIFTGFRIAIGVSWMSIVAAELIAAPSGLGYMIIFYRETLRTDAIIVGMLTIGVIGLAMDLGTRWLEQRLMPWRQGVQLP
jgi:ABC-type nitrate/sulfonate/bicarbonate transport system permease component